MKETTHILIVEDKSADADLARYTIQKVLKGCEFQVVETRKDFLNALEVFQPDVILSDYSLPRFDGMKALKLALEHAPLSPLIIWTGSISEDVAVECMKAGANNYILKENIKRLAPAVIHALEERQLLLERKQAEEALQHSEKRFRALIENGLDNISLLKADGTLIWESPAAIRMLDYAPDEFVGHNIFALMHLDDMDWTRDLYARLIQEPGSHQRGTFRLRRSDGTWRWVDAIVTNMLNEPSVNAIVVNYRDITDQKEAEKALRESQSKYQHLVETSHDLIWSIDAEGKFTFINDASKQLYGYEPQELMGHSFFEMMDPQHHQMDLKRFQETIAHTNEFREAESHVRHRDGREIILSANAIVIRDNDGNVIGVTGSSHDITIRKRVEDVLKEERNLLRTLIDNIPDRIYAMDLHGRKTLSNTADWKASSGKTMEDVIGKTDFEMYPPELAEEFWRLNRTVLDLGQPIINYEEPGLDYEGNPVSILTTKIPLRDDKGNMIGLVGIGRDITERKQVEMSLRQSENRYRLVTKATNDVIWEWNPTTSQLLWSENAQHVFGYPPEEIGPEEKWWDDHIHPDDRIRVLEKLNALIAGDESLWQEEYRFLLNDGSYAYISDRAYIERDENGDPIRMIGAMSDITSRKEAEVERQALLEIMQGLTNTTDLQELLELIHYSIAKVIYARNFFAILYDEQNRSFEEIYSVDQYDAPAPPSKLEKSITSYVFRSSEPLLLTQERFDELVEQGEVELVGTNSASWLGVPLKTSGGTIGVIAVQDYEISNRYSERDKEFLVSIASQIALAINRRQAAEIIRESELRYRGLFENLVIGFALHEIVVDDNNQPIDYIFLEINPAFEKLTGIHADQAVGKRVREILPGVENDHFIQIYGRVALTGVPVHFEEFSEQDGKHYEINAYSPKRGQFAVTFNDITERKQAEEALHKSEALYRQAMEVAGAVPYYESYYDEGRLIKYEFIGEGIRELTGYGPDEFNAKIWDSLVEEVNLVEDLAGYSLDEGIQRVRAGENSIWKCEHRLRDRDGNIHWVFEAAVELRDENGVSHGSIGTYQDITARKQAVDSEHEQRALAEALRDTAETLSSTLDYGEVLDHILAAVGRVVPHDAATIMLIEGEYARIVRSLGYDKRSSDFEIMGVELPLMETNNLRQMFETGKTVVVHDTHSYPGWKRLTATDWLRSNVGAPISIQGQVIGFILLDSQTPGFFTPIHAERLEAFANQAALAIHNARLLQRAQEEITERKRAEDLLRESERRYRALFDDMPVAVWEDDLSELHKYLDSLKEQNIRDFHKYFETHPEELVRSRRLVRILNVNKAAVELYQARSKEELIQSTLQDMGKGELKYWIDDLTAIANGETTHRWEGGDETMNDTPIEISLSWTVVPGHENDYSKVIFTTVDITERKRAEQELWAEREKAQKYLDIAGVILLALDRDGIVTLINQKGCEILGYSAEEIIGKNWINTFLPESNREELQIVFSQLAAGDFQTLGYYENTILAKGGEERLIAWHNTLLSDEQGRIVNTLSSGEDITERKQAEAQLRASEERFRQLADNIQEVFWMTDAESGEEIYMSPAAEAIWGLSVETLMYKPNAFINSIFPEDQPSVLQAIEKEKNGEKVDIEYRIIQPNGSIRWVWDRAFPIFDDMGKVKRIAGISADITERRESEIALIKSQSRYRELFDSSPISIWEEDYSLVKKQIDLLLESGIKDLKEYFSSHPDEVTTLASLVKVTDINKVSLELYQVEHKEDLLNSLTQVMGSEPLSHFEEEILGLIGPLKRFIWEGADKTINGRRMEVIVNGSIPEGYEEDWSKVIVSIIDITERRQVEQQLRKLSRAVEQSASTIVITDTVGNIEYVNPKFTEITGYTLEEALGQNPRILKSGFTSDKVYKQLWQTVASGKEWHGELLNKKKNDELYWEYVTISPILNERGEITHFVGVKEDITQRKQSEVEIQRHLTDLEALYENGLAVGRLLKTNEIGNRVINTFAQYLQWHHVTIRLRREESDDLDLVAFNLPGLRDEERAATEQHFTTLINKIGHGLSGWVIQTGVPVRTGDVHAYPQYVDMHAGIRSGLYMPLKVGELVIGVISVESESPDAFTEQDERLLATLANQAAISFENARLYEAIQKELSERKRAVRALRASEVHYRELADSITDILFELDQDLHYTHWNKASETLTGIPAKDAIGKPMHEIFGESEEQTRISQIYESVLKNRQPITFETVLFLNGQKGSFEINAYPSTRGVSVVAKDVTARKRSEIILQKRFELIEFSAHHSLNELMQKTIDEVSELTGSSIGFLHFVDEDQIALGMQTWSTSTLQLFQVPVSEGKHLPLDQAGVWAEAARQRHPLIQNDYESVAKRKGLPPGHVLITRELVIPIIRNERIMAIMGIANKSQDYTPDDLEIAARLADYAWDITERKQMELALEVERNQLAQRVDERTADLSRANSNLARALRVKDEFLANMSHELRTPLNAILGLSESLSEQIAGPLNEKQQKYISTISESGHHLLSLINDILDLAKIDAGQITLDINKVDIHSVCHASLRMIKQLAQKKNQDVSLEIDEGLGLMWADERRLKQMLVNLLGNAVKFTPENGRLGLEVHGYEEANKISFTVWDKGVGIREADLARLFQPFVQLDSGLARETTGTGLGLALVAQMARLHGGSIQADSKPETGSRFTVVLPWEPALAMDAATRMKITGKFRAIKLDEKNKPIILVVEDTQEVTMIIKDYLELAGYRVVTAQDGVDAIVQAKLIRPDLILMDVQMPRMDGLEATRKLRSEPDFRYTPIIALTALAMSGDRERCLEAGMDEYISKPVNLKTLIKLIQGCLFSSQEVKSR
jgi:PAS domain S-box-containing protein